MGRQAEIVDDQGVPLTLGNRISDSGEAMVYRLADDDTRLVKLHHAPSPAMRAKLAALPGLAPADPSLDPRHRNFAWPVSAVFNAKGEAVGTILPTVPGARSLTALGNPKLRARRAEEMNWHYLHAVAANVAFLFEYLHEAGIVVGDIKPDNILVDDHALATLIDCDSLQVPAPDGTAYLCPVGSEGFTAPEWIDRRFDGAPRSETADRFGLAVLLYQLLTGAHPWTGEWMGAGDPPPRDHLIRSGDWPWRPGARLRPIPGLLPPDALNPELAALFRQTFIAGAKDPDARASAADWHSAICNALAELEPCSAQAHHHHDAALAECPWCARVQAGLPDLFPKPASAGNPYAALIHAFERALARGDTRMAVELWQDNPVLSRSDTLAGLGGLLANLGQAITALDSWKQGDPDDLYRLSAIADDAPMLTDQSLFRHEDIAGEAVAPRVRQVIEAALTIPPRPDIDGVAAPVTAVPIPAPMPEAAADAPTLTYRIDSGWQGLRPARLTLTLAKPGAIPALALCDEASGQVLMSIPAQRLRRPLVLPFDQPEGQPGGQSGNKPGERRVLCVIPAATNCTCPVNIVAPPLRQRCIGNTLAAMAGPVPGLA